MKKPKYPSCKAEVAIRDFVYPCELEMPHKVHQFTYASSSKIVGIHWREIKKVK